MKRNYFLYGGIIALSFLWTGSAYISVAYRLMETYTTLDIDIFHVIIGYLLQVSGMLLFMLGVRKKTDIVTHKKYFIIILVAEAIVITAAMLASMDSLAFGLAFIMNLLHGMVAGFYLMILSSYVPQQHRGRVFGFGYAFGSVGSWLLSLPYGGKFLKMEGIVIVYIILIVSTLLLTLKIAKEHSIESDASSKGMFDKKSIIHIFAVLVLLSLVKNLGFYFPASDISRIINLEFSRAFYAVGLIVAGIINDINRRYGAICSVAALSFAFISFALKNNPEYSATVWILGYIFFGFFSVYRVVVFSDIASKRTSFLSLAAFGLMAGRIGDSLGTLGGVLLSDQIIPLILATSILFILVIFLFFPIYNKLYISNMTESERKQQQYEAFESKNSLSRRESEVFRLIVQGFSNLEISGALYVSESTVKYHVGNILKKTDCSNRTELTMIFRGNQ